MTQRMRLLILSTKFLNPKAITSSRMRCAAFAVACSFALQPSVGSAFQSIVLPDYDSEFVALCNGFACEQAVPEVRNGDNGTTAAQVEWNIGPDTSNPTDSVNISNSANGFWADEVSGAITSRDFSLSYDGATLSLMVDSGGLVSDETVFFGVDLSPTQSMYIRAASSAIVAPTVLANLQLNGQDVNGGMFSGDSSADYLAIFDFDWDSSWALTGQIEMEGNSGSSGARPSIQWKMTNLQVPEPTSVALVGLTACGLGLSRIRKRNR